MQPALQNRTYIVACLLAFFLGLALLTGCEDNTSAPTATPVLDPPPPCLPNAPDNCAAAVVLTIDKSGSMDDEVDGNDTILDKVKQAAATVVGSVPPGQWKMGITTFPSDNGIPVTPDLLLVTDSPDTRQQLVNLINGLSAGGGTNILTGGYQALSLLQTETDRQRFLVFFSDGKICMTDDCSFVKDMANYIKSRNVSIATVGYHLAGSDRDKMEYIASPLPDGSKAFVNSASGSTLFGDIKNMLESLCRFQPVSLEFSPSEVDITQEGSDTVTMIARHHFGSRREYRLLSYGGQIVTEPSEEFIILGPDESECVSTQKVKVTATAYSIPGTRFGGLYAWDTEDQAVRASQVLTAKVSGFSADVDFVETPVWTGGHYLGKVLIHPEITTEVPVTISLLVRKTGESDTAEGWELALFPQSTATLAPDTDFTVTYQLTPPDNMDWSDSYVMEVLVTGLGRRFTDEREIDPPQ